MAENNEIHNIKIVSWQVFVWAIGIILLVFGISFTTIGSVSNRVDKYTDDVNNLKIDMREVKTNVIWIRQILETNKAFIGGIKTVK